MYNATRHAHIAGHMLSMSENGGDYFLASRAIRNTIESLPNNLKLHCNFLSPLPAFFALSPLKFRASSNKYIQPCNIESQAAYSDSFGSNIADNQRKMVSNEVQFFPSLIVDAVTNTGQTSLSFIQK